MCWSEPGCWSLTAASAGCVSTLRTHMETLVAPGQVLWPGLSPLCLLLSLQPLMGTLQCCLFLEGSSSWCAGDTVGTSGSGTWTRQHRLWGVLS